MVRFYKIFLSATPSFESELFCFMTYDDEHHRIGIPNLPNIGKKNPAHSGLERVAFTFNNLEELALSYLQRKAHGIVPYWTVNHGLTISVYYKDPDDNILETQVDNFDDLKEADAFVKPEFIR